MSMTSHAVRALVCGSVLALAALVALANEDGASPPTLADVLARIEAKSATVRDFRARFRQEKSVYLLDRPLRSEGVLLFRRPGLLRLETRAPAPSSLVIDDAGMKVYLPALRQVEVYDFAGREALGTLLPLFGLSADELKRSYEATLDLGDPGAFTLVLVPKSDRVRRVVERIEAAVARDTLLPRRLRLLDPNGDASLTTFDDVELNVGLGDADFRLDLPPDVRVKKPLGGMPF